MDAKRERYAGVAGIPTAFVATFGSGKPVIGIVGEFDALPGLSQEAQTANHHVIEEGAPGHGCGHNLLGTGALTAAVAVKEWLIASGHTGTLRYYGTPAEEGGSGKVYFQKARAEFDQRRGPNFVYKTRLADRKPALDYRK